MIEFTTLINRNKIFSLIMNSIINYFFLIVRKFYQINSTKDGRVVIIALHKLGDTVFTIPAILALQNFYKKKIVICCYPESIPIYNIILVNAEFCPVQNKEFKFGNRLASFKARKIIKKTKPEVIFDFTGVMTSATLIFNSRAREIIGTNRNHFKSIYDVYVNLRKTPHLMDIYLDIAETKVAALKRNQLKTFPVVISDYKKILIHPLAGWKAKEWSLTKYIQLSKSLNRYYDVCIIFPSGKLTKDIISELEKLNLEYYETNSVDSLIEQINKCSLFIGNDSGPLNIASLLGKPTFAIYGPTNQIFSLPMSEHHEFIRKEIKCLPNKNNKYCFTNGGRTCVSFECMDQLSHNEVLTKVNHFMRELDQNIKRTKE